MNLSVMLFPFHSRLSDGQLTAAGVIDALSKEGTTAIEPMLSWLDADPAKWEEFRKTTVDKGLSFSCLDIGANLVGQSDADREAALDTVERGVAIACEQLECPVVLVAGSKADPALGDADSRKVYGETLIKAVERVNGANVTMTIEDFGVYPTFTAAGGHCKEVLDVAAPGNVKFTFDNGNFLLGGDTPTQVYELFKDCIAHVHIKDFALRPDDDSPSLTAPNKKKYKGCMIGEGEAEVTGTLELLKADGYDKWVSIEVGGNPLAEAVHGVRFVREAWEQI